MTLILQLCFGVTALSAHQASLHTLMRACPYVIFQSSNEPSRDAEEVRLPGAQTSPLCGEPVRRPRTNKIRFPGRREFFYGELREPEELRASVPRRTTSASVRQLSFSIMRAL